MLSPMSNSLLLAVGSNGLQLNIPDGIVVETCAELESGSVRPPPQQQDVIRHALDAAQLKTLAKEKRRAVILTGGLALPGPYDIALPAVIKALIDAEIRPSRISILVCPGGAGPVLGTNAIHRYGEEVVGEHELRAISEDGADLLLESADLRIAVAPTIGPLNALNLAGAAATFDLAIELTLGRKIQMDVESARALDAAPAAARENVASGDVFLCSGGGAPWESTLEEALLSLYLATTTSRTAVLAFEGGEGLGSSRFTLDFLAMLQQAGELLAGGGSLAGMIPRPAVYDPAGALAHVLSSTDHLVLFSRAFSEHSDGDDLLEFLAAQPALAGHLSLLSSEAQLWPLLKSRHGDAFKMSAQPLGWRGYQR